MAEQPDPPEAPGQPGGGAPGGAGAEAGGAGDGNKGGDLGPLLQLLGNGGVIALALATVGLIFTFLDYKPEDMPTLVRNAPLPMGAALIVVLFGVIVSVYALFFADDKEDRKRVQKWGYMVFGLGIVIAVGTGVYGWNHPEYPHFEDVGFHLTDQGFRVEATLKGSRLPSNYRIVASVDTLARATTNRGLTSTGSGSTAGNEWFPTSQRVDSFGPDADGSVNRTISALLPYGTYQHVGLVAWILGNHKLDRAADCYDNGSKDKRISCVILSTENPVEQPQLTVAWAKATETARLLRVNLSMRNTVRREVRLTVTALRPNARRFEVAAYALQPPLSGKFIRNVLVAIPKGFRRVCVVARADGGPTGCPLYPRRGARRGTVWTVLAVPSGG